MMKLIIVFRNFAKAPKMFQTKIVEKIKARNLCSKILTTIVPFMRQCGKI
jgi:hypothetical protein